MLCVCGGGGGEHGRHRFDMLVTAVVTGNGYLWRAINQTPLPRTTPFTITPPLTTSVLRVPADMDSTGSLPNSCLLNESNQLFTIVIRKNRRIQRHLTNRPLISLLYFKFNEITRRVQTSAQWQGGSDRNRASGVRVSRLLTRMTSKI